LNRPSRRAVWLAANSDKGDRLVQIATEHTRLARRISDGRKAGTINLKETSALMDRIEELRAEREAIIQQFA